MTDPIRTLVEAVSDGLAAWESLAHQAVRMNLKAMKDVAPGTTAVLACQKVRAALPAARAALDAGVGWEDIAAQYARNVDYYRGLVVQIGTLFGVAAKTADDGGVHEDVLCAKVPELVVALAEENARLRGEK